jgi:hypothetical protein
MLRDTYSMMTDPRDDEIDLDSLDCEEDEYLASFEHHEEDDPVISLDRMLDGPVRAEIVVAPAFEPRQAPDENDPDQKAMERRRCLIVSRARAMRRKS